MYYQDVAHPGKFPVYGPAGDLSYRQLYELQYLAHQPVIKRPVCQHTAPRLVKLMCARSGHKNADGRCLCHPEKVIPHIREKINLPPKPTELKFSDDESEKMVFSYETTESDISRSDESGKDDQIHNSSGSSSLTKEMFPEDEKDSDGGGSISESIEFDLSFRDEMADGFDDFAMDAIAASDNILESSEQVETQVEEYCLSSDENANECEYLANNKSDEPRVPAPCEGLLKSDDDERSDLSHAEDVEIYDSTPNVNFGDVEGITSEEDVSDTENSVKYQAQNMDKAGEDSFRSSEVEMKDNDDLSDISNIDELEFCYKTQNLHIGDIASIVPCLNLDRGTVFQNVTENVNYGDICDLAPFQDQPVQDDKEESVPTPKFDLAGFLEAERQKKQARLAEKGICQEKVAFNFGDLPAEKEDVMIPLLDLGEESAEEDPYEFDDEGRKIWDMGPDESDSEVSEETATRIEHKQRNFKVTYANGVEIPPLNLRRLACRTKEEIMNMVMEEEPPTPKEPTPKKPSPMQLSPKQFSPKQPSTKLDSEAAIEAHGNTDDCNKSTESQNKHDAEAENDSTPYFDYKDDFRSLSDEPKSLSSNLMKSQIPISNETKKSKKIGKSKIDKKQQNSKPIPEPLESLEPIKLDPTASKKVQISAKGGLEVLKNEKSRKNSSLLGSIPSLTSDQTPQKQNKKKSAKKSKVAKSSQAAIDALFDNLL